MIMLWNINNYKRREYDDIKTYEDIIRTKDITHAVKRINANRRKVCA